MLSSCLVNDVSSSRRSFRSPFRSETFLILVTITEEMWGLAVLRIAYQN